MLLSLSQSFLALPSSLRANKEPLIIEEGSKEGDWFGLRLDERRIGMLFFLKNLVIKKQSTRQYAFPCVCLKLDFLSITACFVSKCSPEFCKLKSFVASFATRFFSFSESLSSSSFFLAAHNPSNSTQDHRRRRLRQEMLALRHRCPTVCQRPSWPHLLLGEIKPFSPPRGPCSDEKVTGQP